MDIDVDANTLEQLKNLTKVYDLIVQLTGAKPFAKLPDHPKPGVTTNVIDLDVSNKIAACLSTLFAAMRKEKMKTRSPPDLTNIVVKINDTSLKIGELIDQIKEKEIMFDFDVVTPIVYILSAFKYSFNECKSGVTKFHAGREKQVQHQIGEYGLNEEHIPLLQGITFPPAWKKELVKGLSPISQCILLLNEKKYYTKICAALRSSLNILVMKKEIIKCLRRAQSHLHLPQLLKELADLLVITTGRSVQNIYYPLTLAVEALRHSKPTGEWNLAGPHLQHHVTKFIEQNGIMFKMKSNGSAEATKQAVFHSIFGTYLDDLSTLDQITNEKNWLKRIDLSSVYESTSKELIFEPIQQTMFFKTTPSVLTNELYSQCIGVSCFSGYTTTRFSPHFFIYMKSRRLEYSLDAASLAMAVSKIKDCLDKDDPCTLSSPKWYKASSTGELEADETFELVKSGNYFYHS